MLKNKNIYCPLNRTLVITGLIMTGNHDIHINLKMYKYHLQTYQLYYVTKYINYEVLQHDQYNKKIFLFAVLFAKPFFYLFY